MKAIAMAVVALSLAGCARLQVYSDAEMKTETGFRYYTTKPYVLVVRTGAKDKPVEASVVYLPDLANPQYVRAGVGMGSNKLSMNFTNSVMTSFNQETDAKIPDLLNSVGGLAKIVADIRKAESKDAGSDVGSFDLYEIDAKSGKLTKLAK